MLFEEVAERLWQKASSIWIPRLLDETPSVRAAAVRALANLRDRRGIDPLISALDDQDPIVREAVVRAIEPFCDGRSHGRLHNLLKRALSRDAAATVRLAAAEVMETLRDPQATEALVEALHDPDPVVVRSAQRALISIVDANPGARHEDIVEPLTTYLLHDDPGVRTAVAKLLGRVHGGGSAAGVADALLEALRDRHQDVQAAANGALLALGDPRPEARLRRLLYAQDSGVAAEALERLLSTDDEHAGRLLVAILRDRKTEPGRRAQAARQLGRFSAHGEEEGFVSSVITANLLEQTLELEDGWGAGRRPDEVRSAARQALLDILSREPIVAGDFLASMFDSTSVDAQIAAIGILRALDVRLLENVYQEVTRGPDSLRWAVIEGHIDAVIASEGWEGVLCELYHPNIKMRWAAITAIEEVGGARAIMPLAEVAADAEQDDDLRREVVRVLAKFGDPRVVPALLTICEDDEASQELTGAALDALVAIGGLQARVALRGLSERHELEWLGEAARTALGKIDD